MGHLTCLRPLHPLHLSLETWMTTLQLQRFVVAKPFPAIMLSDFQVSQVVNVVEKDQIHLFCPVETFEDNAYLLLSPRKISNGMLLLKTWFLRQVSTFSILVRVLCCHTSAIALIRRSYYAYRPIS
jgi:hypothetical protein